MTLAEKRRYAFEAALFVPSLFILLVFSQRSVVSEQLCRQSIFEYQFAFLSRMVEITPVVCQAVGLYFFVFYSTLLLNLLIAVVFLLLGIFSENSSEIYNDRWKLIAIGIFFKFCIVVSWFPQAALSHPAMKAVFFKSPTAYFIVQSICVQWLSLLVIAAVVRFVALAFDYRGGVHG